MSIVKNVALVISNLCSKSIPDFIVVRASLPMLSRLLNHVDLEVVRDACWALSNLSERENDRIVVEIDSGLVPRLVDLTESTNVSVLTSAFRCVGKLARLSFMIAVYLNFK